MMLIACLRGVLEKRRGFHNIPNPHKHSCRQIENHKRALLSISFSLFCKLIVYLKSPNTWKIIVEWIIDTSHSTKLVLAREIFVYMRIKMKQLFQVGHCCVFFSFWVDCARLTFFLNLLSIATWVQSETAGVTGSCRFIKHTRERKRDWLK